MKNFNFKFLILTFIFSSILNIQSLFANNHPPSPKGGGLDDSFPVGANGAIDNHIIFLFVAAILLGLFAINKFRAVHDS
jgi:hypothetical protein